MGNDGLQLKAGLAILAVLGGLLLYRAVHPSTTFAADGLDSSWDRDVQRSQSSGRPALLIFTANWCPYCVKLHEEVLSREDVQGELARHYTLHTVDLSHPSPQDMTHARQFGASGIPLVIRYDINGKETARTNYMDADAMLAWLKAGE
jgi:thiol:disulfide interchange protein